jgi:predicted nucleotidyltransferase
MLDQIPEPKRGLLGNIVEALAAVPNMEAIVLGGSHARGMHLPNSDLDLGLYYRDSAPLEVEAVKAVALAFSDRGAPVVTGFYEWGPWVNGGAWVHNSVSKIDFLYRSLDDVERTIEEAERGIWQHHYDQQPPFGFRSVIYLAETACAVPLYDPAGQIERLKERTRIYPAALKERIVSDTLWGAEFSLIFAGDFARKSDVQNTAASLTRVYHYLVQALFALNETYFINDKGSERVIETFSRRPGEFTATTARILGHIGSDRTSLERSVKAFRQVFATTVALTEGGYRPRWSFELISE